MSELLIGCGNQRRKIVATSNGADWTKLTTLDLDPNCGADVEWDLGRLPLPFPDESFDEIHAYHVLEHVGQQGDWRFFFAQFADFWRMLKPDGFMCAGQPTANSEWMWGDPGHTRFIGESTLIFLDQETYAQQVGVTALADYRHVYKADFKKVFSQIIVDDNAPQLFFALRAVKPSRFGSFA